MTLWASPVLTPLWLSGPMGLPAGKCHREAFKVVGVLQASWFEYRTRHSENFLGVTIPCGTLRTMVAPVGLLLSLMPASA